jgi:ribosomal protein S27AE
MSSKMSVMCDEYTCPECGGVLNDGSDGLGMYCLDCGYMYWDGFNTRLGEHILSDFEEDEETNSWLKKYEPGAKEQVRIDGVWTWVYKSEKKRGIYELLSHFVCHFILQLKDRADFDENDALSGLLSGF